MSNVAAAKSDLVARLPRACADELAAVEFMEEQRWGTTPNCPRCGDTDVSMMKAKDGSRNVRFLWRCHGCKKQYTVRVGTVMEDSPIALRHWCLAFYRACSSKKGVSALQIQRETGLTYKSALFLMHRIRWAMAPANDSEPKLSGTVEYDEHYYGGKPRGVPNYMLIGTELRKARGPRPDFKDRKTPIVAGVERGGRVKARVVSNVTPATLKAHVRNMVDTSATLITDERTGYKGLDKEYAAHHTINHSRAQWANGDITTNRAEGFFALLKRGMVGTYHSVSKKHLHRYVSEAEFKYNSRSLDDGARTVRAIQAADNKRLTYKAQVGR